MELVLDALMQHGKNPTDPQPTMWIDPAHIDFAKNQRKRSDEAKYQSLLLNIRQSGQNIPAAANLVHTPAGARLEGIYGGRRHRVAIELERPLLVTVYMGLSAKRVQDLQFDENDQHEVLNPVDRAMAVIGLLQEYGGDKEAVARVHGQTAEWVTRHIYLQRLTPQVLELVADYLLPLQHARLIATMGDPIDQIDVSSAVINCHHWASIAKCALKGETSSDYLEKFWQARRHSTGQNIKSIEETRQLIAERTRPLKNLPVLKDQKVGEFRPCVGCQHCTNSDPILFAESIPDAEAEQGFCLNQACYEGKLAFVEAARQAALKKVVKQKLEPSAKTFREIAPAGVKPEAIQGFVKRELDKAEESGNEPGAAPKASDDQRRNEALRNYDRALAAWQQGAGDDIANEMTPVQLVMWYLITRSRLWTQGDYYIKTEDYQNRRNIITEPPAQPHPTAGLSLLMSLLKEPTLLGLEKIVKEANNMPSPGVIGTSPVVALALAKALEVKLKDPPLFEDFLPEDLRPQSSAPSPAAPDAVVKRGPGRPKGSKTNAIATEKGK